MTKVEAIEKAANPFGKAAFFFDIQKRAQRAIATRRDLCYNVPHAFY